MCKRNQSDVSAYYLIASKPKVFSTFNKHKDDIDKRKLLFLFFISERKFLFGKLNVKKMYQDQPPSYNEAISSPITPSAPPG